MALLNKKKKQGPLTKKKNGKSEEERRTEIMDAINQVIKDDDTKDPEKLSRLLISTAFLENSLGVNDEAYGRDYTNSQFSVDQGFLDDILSKSGYAVDEHGNKTDELRKNNYNKFLQKAGYNPGDPASMEKFVKDLRNDNALTGAYMARLRYSLSTDPLPDISKEDTWQAWYKDYNGGGLGEEGSEDYNKLLNTFNEFYDDFFDQDVPSETDDSDPQGMTPKFTEEGQDIFSPGSWI